MAHAAVVELAGTPPSETSPTRNIEEFGEVIFGAVFLIGYHDTGVVIESYINVTPLISKTLNAVLAANNLTGTGKAAQDTIVRHINFMRIRARFVASTGAPGPYFIKTRGELTQDILASYLRGLTRAELASFLESAKL